MKLKRILLKEAGVPNVNGVVYSNEALQSIEEQINETGEIYGELGQSFEIFHHGIIDIRNIVTKTTSSEYIDDKLFIDVEILPTPSSNIIPKNKNGEYDLSEFTFGMRGYANDMKDSTVLDFSLVSIDLIRKKDTLADDINEDIIPFC